MRSLRASLADAQTSAAYSRPFCVAARRDSNEDVMYMLDVFTRLSMHGRSSCPAGVRYSAPVCARVNRQACSTIAR